MRNKRGQSVAEYAVLIGVVIAAIVGMQLYVKRSLQGKVKAVADRFADDRTGVPTPRQYEPYYTAAGGIESVTNNSEKPFMAAGAMITINDIKKAKSMIAANAGSLNRGVIIIFRKS